MLYKCIIYKYIISTLSVVMTLLSAKLYNTLTLDFSIFFAKLNFSCKVPPSAVAVRVGCTLNTIYYPLTNGVNITFSNFLQLSSVVIVLQELQITSSSSNNSPFHSHFVQNICSFKESNSKQRISLVTWP